MSPTRPSSGAARMPTLTARAASLQIVDSQAGSLSAASSTEAASWSQPDSEAELGFGG